MTTGPGFLLVDKAGGWTSHDVVAKTRGLLGIRKIGHAGTLDPMATGLLVLGIGAATRLLRFITDQPKEYLATVCLGVATDTLDAEGEVMDRRPMTVTMDDVAEVMKRFIGDILQTPPMVSAVKIGGKRLHHLARRGQEVERPARSVRVESLRLEGFEPGPYPRVRLRVVGGRGLYVRVLADDMAIALGGRGHLTELRRIRSGQLEVEDARTVEQLEELRGKDRLSDAILAPGDGLAHLPKLAMDGEEKAVQNGRRFPVESGHPTGEAVAMMSGPDLLAVYRVGDGELAPEVVLPVRNNP